MTQKAYLGILGEKLAANYLKKKGYQIIERNFKKLPWGEIDIIARKENYLFFFEVKTISWSPRKTSPFLPELKINYHKKRALARTIQVYLQKQKLFLDSLWQADALIVRIDFRAGRYRIKHFSNILYD